MQATIGQVFETAIAAERAAEQLFLGLEAKFSAHEELAIFWRGYAADEVSHAQWLEELRARLTPEKLGGLADSGTMNLLHAVAGFSVEKALGGVKDLEDAYQLVSEVESAETNAIFGFLVDNFEADEQVRGFLRSQLNSHVAKLMIDLPAQYRGTGARRAIRAAE